MTYLNCTIALLTASAIFSATAASANKPPEYRGSGRNVPDVTTIVQGYNPPDVGAPCCTTGTGTRRTR